MDSFRTDTSAEIASVAARLVVDEGLEYAAAKRRAAKQLGLPPSRTPWPDNQMLELALIWMDRLATFRPHLCGAVWHGTATRHSDIYVQLYCDDPKAAEWALLDHRVEYHPGTAASDAQGEPVEALTLRLRCDALGQWVLLHLLVLDHDALRGALKPDAQGRRPRGDAHDVRALLASDTASRQEGA
jgi:hypothetical protein